MSAYGECFGNSTREEPFAEEKPEKKCPSGRKGKKCRERKRKNACPTVKKIKTKAMEEMKDHICVLEQMGWIDSNGNEVVEVMEADVASLPVEAEQFENNLEEEAE